VKTIRETARRGASNRWCATYTRPANENCTFATFEQCGPIRSLIRTALADGSEAH